MTPTPISTDVDTGENARDGTRVLDAAALARNVDRVMALPLADPDRLDNDRLRTALVQAVLDAVPAGIEAVAVDGMHQPDAAAAPVAWIAVAIRRPNGNVLSIGQDLASIGSAGMGAIARARVARIVDPGLAFALRFDGTGHLFMEEAADA
jgi:hypothetical protein